MARITNGPARNTPKGARTRAELAATVPANPTRCHCPHGNGIVVVTFHDQRVTRVERRHLAAAYGCGMATQHEQPADYYTPSRR